MSYQALARTWRPRRFSELVGQEHVVKALVHALDQDRLHHAYLFTGTRGVGKTTIARILAKSLNCEQGVSSTPCGECSACQEIDAGRFVDLLEVDAASRTKVDDTRELLDNVQYAPSRGRYKVYLIDEVHMLSSHSFNALLKTLEEPPPHVKFLLATTDPQRLPVTVLSRCLQFNLKRLPPGLIRERLAVVADAEGLEHEPGALAQIARAADGSMRDGLSLLDQAAAYCSGRLEEAEVRAMLGTIDRHHAEQLLGRLAAGDARGLLAAVVEMDERVPDYVAALDELALLIQRVALAQVSDETLGEEDDDAGAVRGLAEAIPAEDLQLFYQIALVGKRDLHLAPSMRAGFEMVLLRMLAFRPAGQEEAGTAGGAGVARPGPTPTTGPARSRGQSATVATKQASPADPSPGRASAPDPAAGDEEVADWPAFLERLGLSGAVRQLAANSQLAGWDGMLLRLVLDESRAHLRTEALVEKLGQAVAVHLGRAVKIRVDLGRPASETVAQRRDREADQRQRAAAASIDKDPNVAAMRKAFGATVDPATIRPTEH